MQTLSVKPSEVKKKWYLIDAEDLVLGRLASVVAKILRGKHKTCFTPHVDCGDCVVIINAEKAILTGAKAEQKYYRHHTGWVGGLKEVKYGILMDKNPEFAMELAVKGMLPNNSLGRNAFSRLRVFKGPEHNHQAQKPEVYEG